MPVDYVDFEQARTAEGLRMVVVTGVPSPWGEAAKGIFHVKQIPWKAIKVDQTNDDLAEWAKQRGGPVAVYENEAPRSGWAEILLLAERLNPTPALLPADALDRTQLMGLSHEICGEGGLGWTRRLQGIHNGLTGGPGFPPPVAAYLSTKYGYRPDEAARLQRRVNELLEMLAKILHTQQSVGSRFYIGRGLSAVDIYSAAFMALFKPLPLDQCPIIEALRPAFESLDEVTAKALDPILLEHRDFVYDEFLELPLTL